MKERPILFSGAMVRALLAGTKTQTRRIAPLRVVDDVTTIRLVTGEHRGCYAYVTDALGVAWSPAGGDPLERYPHPEFACPYGVPGDRLWVRETWMPVGCSPCEVEYATQVTCTGHVCKTPSGCRFRADHPDDPAHGLWRPSIHMPRWASRIMLEVTDVRVERLQAITEEDARAEGIHEFRLPNGSVFGVQGVRGTDVGASAVEAYAILWDQINADRAPWASNPWVWAVAFRRVQA